MADASINDPYAEAHTEAEQQAIYQKLQAQYAKDRAIWEQKEIERREDIYQKYRENWVQQHNVQRESDDRAHRSILTVAAGSFGVSFAFINQVVPLKEAEYLPVLIVAWVLFGFSIIMSVLEPKIESVIQDILLDNIEKNMSREYEGKQIKETKRWLTMWPTRITGWLAFLSFVGGIVCLLCFVLLNTVL